jgi:hypothetical protein
MGVLVNRFSTMFYSESVLDNLASFAVIMNATKKYKSKVKIKGMDNLQYAP